MNIYFANYDRNGMTAVEESKYQHAVGRQLLKTALLRAGVSKDFLSKEESLIFAYGPSGKPFFHDLPDVHFNISHTGGLVVCAVGNIPIGIDAERIRPYPKSVLRKMTDRERLYIQKRERDLRLLKGQNVCRERYCICTARGRCAMKRLYPVRCRIFIGDSWSGRGSMS